VGVSELDIPILVSGGLPCLLPPGSCRTPVDRRMIACQSSATPVRPAGWACHRAAAATSAASGGLSAGQLTGEGVQPPQTLNNPRGW